MTADVKRRLSLLAALLVGLSGLGAVMFSSMGENLVYFWDAKQVLENGDKAVGATIRLGGLVEEGSVQWDEQTRELNFVVTDGTGDYEVPAHTKGAPPQMFREGIGVVLEGTMSPAGVFEADRVLVKHSNEYKAPEEGVAAKELYSTLEEEF